MPTLALSGGFGNVLFQLNLFFSCKHLFGAVSSEGAHVRALRKARSLNCPSQVNFLNALGISSLCRQSPQSARDYCLLGLSNRLRKPVLGRYWNNFTDPCELPSSTTLFKTYAQYQVPLQDEFIAILKNRLIQPRSHLLHLAAKYDALVHVRCGDLSRTADVSDYYHKVADMYSNYLVVTDDPIHASHLFPRLCASDIISSDSYLDDFALLSFANNLVCSNSTFAWWASELSSATSVIEPLDYKLGIHFNPISRHMRHKL
jgi:hypothetical protein